MIRFPILVVSQDQGGQEVVWLYDFQGSAVSLTPTG